MFNPFGLEAAVPIAAILATSIVIAGTQEGRATALGSAFATAFPNATVTVDRPAKPRGFNGTLGSAAQVTLSLTPATLIVLGAGRSALVVRETDVLGSHVEPGAIGVAYLKRESRGWRLERVWREYAWTGNTGHPADAFQVARRGSGPALVVWTSQQTNQGDSVTHKWVMTLSRSGPRLEGWPPG